MRTAAASWLWSYMLALLWGMQPLQAAPAASHDFDFVLGNWKARISHRQHSPGAADRWEVWNGSVMAARVWGGRANLQQIEVHAPAGTIEELRLSLYRPLVHQWYLYWADSGDGVLDKPMIGRFKDGRGVFYNQDTYAGRTAFVRNVYFDVEADSYRVEQALSIDGGRTWRTNFIAHVTRKKS